LLRPGYRAAPSAEASTEPVRPFVRRLEDDASALAPHEDFTLSRESALLGQADGLTAAVLKELCPCRLHAVNLDASLYKGSSRQRWFCPPDGGSPRCGGPRRARRAGFCVAPHISSARGSSIRSASAPRNCAARAPSSARWSHERVSIIVG